MKVDFNAVLCDLKGQPIKRDGENIATLGDCAVEALMAVLPDEQNLAGTEKFRRFKLAMKCQGEVDLSIDELKTIKDLVGKCYGPLVVGRVYEILEGCNAEG